jgi:Uma2 family endonuclease
MPSISKTSRYETFRDVFRTIGDVAPERILLDPAPGKGTEQDVLDLQARTKRLYELVDGILVEKIMGLKESVVAAAVSRVLGNFVEENVLGLVAGEAGMIRLTAGLVRIPDISFISWRQLPDRVCPEEPIPQLAPDLAVEVLSEANSPSEMQRKLKDYFFSGVRLVWFLDPRTRSAAIYSTPDQSVVLSEEASLDGGDVLPGLVIPLRLAFARIARQRAVVSEKKPGTKTNRKQRRKPGEAS